MAARVWQRWYRAVGAPARALDHVTAAWVFIERGQCIPPSRDWSAADGAYVLDAAPFDVWVGGTATAALHAEFTVRDGADAPTAAGHAG